MRCAIALLSSILVLCGPAAAQQAADAIAPEGASGTAEIRHAMGDRHMVVAAHPLAAEAGIAMLRKGGSAADAVVAIQTVLGLVEPQSSGLGGGAFLLWYDAESRSVTSFDGRETAPAAADGSLFLDDSGQPLGFFEAVVGGRSVGVPGVPRLLETIHERSGRLDWAETLQPAIELARNGFDVSPRLHALIAGDAGRLDAQPTTRAYFYDETGAPLAIGSTLTNPDYAETLEALAEGGADAFYSGPVAHEIVAAVQGHAGNPGLLTEDDLAGYRVIEREAVCFPYRLHEICGMGPPSSGALTIGQILGMAAHFELGALGTDDPQSWRIIGEASRLAFADRERYMADADFATMPQGLLNADYLAVRAALIRRETALPPEEAVAGDPPWERAELRLDGRSLEQPATTHFVVVDAAGNVASMTSSIENAFGARLMAAGMLLNNQLTDFSFAPESEGRAVANRVEPGKRPRSSMSPTIVLRGGEPRFALGSPGGSNIIGYVANTLIALIDWKMDPLEALGRPHMVNRFGTYELEAGTAALEMAPELEALGFSVEARELNSGLHAIAILPDYMIGVADPRREGVALAD